MALTDKTNTATVQKTLEKTLGKRKQQPSESEPDQYVSKRVRVGDVTAKLTAAEIQAADKSALTAHILALQDHIASTMNTGMPTAMSQDQLDSKVQTARNMMIAGLKSQMKVRSHLKRV